MRQLLHASDDARVSVTINPGTELRRYCGGAYLVPLRACVTQAAVRWRGEPKLHLEQAGWDVIMNPMRGMGLSLARLNAAHVDIGVRQGRRAHAANKKRCPPQP